MSEKMEVWHITNLDDRPLGNNQDNRYPVESVGEAHRLITALANCQLFCNCVESNAFGLEVFRNGEWEEWEDDDGYHISDPAYTYGEKTITEKENMTGVHDGKTSDHNSRISQ